MGNIYELAIIGGGPGGVSAGVYSARKRMKTVFITESFRGQSAVSDNIQNWIGTTSISGEKLASDLEAHLRAYAGDILDIKDGEKVVSVVKDGEVFIIKTNKSEYQAKAVLVTTGSARRKLTVKGADIYEGKGITYCATCDGPMFSGTDVAVIGGGNSAFESALQLSAYAKSVTIVQRSNFKADKITVEKVLSQTNISGLENTDILEIKGDKFVSGIIIKDRSSGKESELSVKGIFVEIGANPSIDFLSGTEIQLTDSKQIVVDPKTQGTSVPGIWSAGDCTDGLFQQNNIAVGDAIKAVEDIYRFLK